MLETSELRPADGDDDVDSDSILLSPANVGATIGWFGTSCDGASVVPALTDWLRTNGCAPADGVTDKVYLARLADQFVLLNHADHEVEKSVTMPDGTSQTVMLPPNSIVDVPITPTAGRTK